MLTQRWSDMDKVVRHRVADLAPNDVPISAGVYAWYWDGKRQYVGKAASLKARLKNHLGQSQALTSSALRRNVAEMLQLGTAAALKRREISLTGEQLAVVRAWLLSCEVAWLLCGSATAAGELERELLNEYRPLLNHR